MKVEVTVCILFIILQITTAEETKSFLPMPMERTCIKQRNLKKDEVESVINEASVYLPENNTEFNEFLGCYWKKKGYQDENGVIHYDNLVHLVEGFSRDKYGGKPNSGNVGLQLARKAVNSCKNVPKGNTPGQTDSRVLNCITQYLEEFVKEEK